MISIPTSCGATHQRREHSAAPKLEVTTPSSLLVIAALGQGVAFNRSEIGPGLHGKSLTSWQREELPYATLALSALIVGLDFGVVQLDAARQNRVGSVTKSIDQGNQARFVDERGGFRLS